MKSLERCAFGAMLLIFVCLSARAGAASAEAEDLKVQEIGYGSLKSISLPASWVLIKALTKPPTFSLQFGPPDNANILITVDDPGGPALPGAKQAFRDLLAGSPDSESPRPLTKDQMRDVSPMLGFGVGDNQFTNNIKYPDPAAPLFQLLDAEVIKVNGKAVVRLNSIYMGEDGKPASYVASITAESPGVGKESVSISAESDDQRQFAELQSTFDRVVKSIVWAK